MLSRSRIRGRFGASLLALGLVAGASTESRAVCYGPQQQLAAPVVADFLANPAALLKQYPEGGAQMISRTRDLVASNPAALPAVMSVIGNASSAQKSAIGTALGQAARICAATDQAFANEIQAAIVKSADQDVRVAYTAVTGDEPLGGLGAGAGAGGGGGAGGQINSLGSAGAASGGVQSIGGGGVGTFSFSYSSSVNGGGSSSRTTIINQSVSPGSN